MVPKGTTEKVARIIHYKRFRTPKIEEFVNGFEYEYVQLSFKEVLSHLPDLDNKGRKPTCTYYENWVKGVWGTPYGIIHKDYIKQAMKKNKIRVRVPTCTKDLKELLKEQALRFHWRGMNIMVFPKKDGIYNVTIDGFDENYLRSKPNKTKKIYDNWFSEFDEEGFKQDWRYLLELDSFSDEKGILYKYFEGVLVPAKSMGVFKHNPKKIPSPHVLQKQEDKAIRSAANVVQEEIKAAIKKQKEFERKQADAKNHAKMELQKMVCVKEISTDKILRLPKRVANKLVAENTHKHVPKHMHKVQAKLDRNVRKKDAEEILTELSVDGKRVFKKPVGPNRKTRRTHPKRKAESQYANYQHIPAVIEIDKKTMAPVLEESKYKTPIPLFEKVPVLYGRRHSTKAGQPFLLPVIGQTYKKVLNCIEEVLFTVKTPKVVSARKTILQHNFSLKKRSKR